MEKTVGRIKNIRYNEDTQDLEFTVFVTDPKFKKKLLRDLALSGNLKVDGDELIFIPKESS